jgi:hypothetical protein
MMDPTQAAPMGAPGAAAAGAAPGANQGSGTVVCIALQPDGSFMVYPEGQDDSGQAFQDVDQALEAAETMLTGQSDQDGDEGGNGSAGTAQDADALFSQGFDSVRKPLNRG